MNPKEFLNIVIEKFPLIKIDFERVKDFADKISDVAVTFGTGGYAPTREEGLSLQYGGMMYYWRYMSTTEITNEDHLRRIVDEIFKSGTSVDKVYLTINPDQPKEDNPGDEHLRRMSEDIANEECQRLVEELNSEDKK